MLYSFFRAYRDPDVTKKEKGINEERSPLPSIHNALVD